MKQVFDRMQIGLFIAVILIAILVIRDQRHTIQKYKDGETMLQGGDIAKQEYIDSLRNELFIQSTNVTRYEIALDRLKEQDSIAAIKFDKALSNIE
jgi:cell division protein FtsL